MQTMLCNRRIPIDKGYPRSSSLQQKGFWCAHLIAVLHDQLQLPTAAASSALLHALLLLKLLQLLLLAGC
jgi:hypothetical protein